MSNNQSSFKDYHLFYFVGILISIFILFMIWHQVPYSSMDYKIYQCAVEVWQDDKDPYDMEVLNTDCTKFQLAYPWRYPPLTLPFFSLFTWLPRHVSWSIFFMLGLIILWLTDKKLQWSYILILLFGSFNAILRNYTIGNIGSIDFMFLALVVYFISKDKYYPAAATIGVMAIFKTVPLAYAAIFIIVCPKWIDKIKYIVVSVFSFLLIHFISFALFQELSVSFYMLVLFGYPIVDGSGFYNPSLLSLIKDVMLNNWAFLVYACLVLVIGLFHLKVMSKVSDKMKQLMLTILAIMVVIPELKMYTYILAVIPIYFLMKDTLYIDRFYLLLLCGAFPLAINYWYLLNKAAYLGTAWEFFFNYSIYFALLITFIILSLKELKKQCQIT